MLERKGFDEGKAFANSSALNGGTSEEKTLDDVRDETWVSVVMTVVMR
jgi:hypothetical protein